MDESLETIEYTSLMSNLNLTPVRSNKNYIKSLLWIVNFNFDFEFKKCTKRIVFIKRRLKINIYHRNK